MSRYDNINAAAYICIFLHSGTRWHSRMCIMKDGKMHDRLIKNGSVQTFTINLINYNLKQCTRHYASINFIIILTKRPDHLASSSPEMNHPAAQWWITQHETGATFHSSIAPWVGNSNHWSSGNGSCPIYRPGIVSRISLIDRRFLHEK